MSTSTKVKSLLYLWVTVCVALLATACTPNRQGGQLTPPPVAPAAPPAANTAPTATPAPAEPEAQPAEQGNVDEPGVEIIMNPTGLSPDEIFASSQKLGEPAIGPRARLGSADDQDKLFYTGASHDFLRDQLSDRLKRIEGRQAEINRDLAQEIGFVRFAVDAKTQGVTLSVTLKDRDRQADIEVKGRLSERRSFRGSATRERLAFEVSCMDLKSTCRTAHIVVKRKTIRGTAVAHVLTRETRAALVAAGPEREASDDLSYLLDVFKRTAQGDEKSVVFMTSETIGGSSEFAVVMRLDSNDPNGRLLGWQGPLVKPQAAIDVRVLTEQIKFKQQPVLTREQKLIVESHLVRNDGRGNIQVALTVRKSAGQTAPAHILLTVARIHLPVAPLN